MAATSSSVSPGATCPRARKSLVASAARFALLAEHRGGVEPELPELLARLAPVDLATAQAMIAEVKGLAPVRGYRGLPRGDLAALAQAIVAVSRLAALPEVTEAEINPLMVLADGVVMADALIATR